jgi:hypothetical protein
MQSHARCLIGMENYFLIYLEIGDCFLISLLCSLNAFGGISSYNLTWNECLPEMNKWVCPTPQCRFCGPHSRLHPDMIQATLAADDAMQSTGAIYFYDSFTHVTNINIFPTDIFIVESGMHGSQSTLISHVHSNIMTLKSSFKAQYVHSNIQPKFIWLVSWVPNFPTATGGYDINQLKSIQTLKGNMNCKYYGNYGRVNLELQEIQKFKSELDGIIWLEGTHRIGFAKVGGGDHHNNLGDCLHFCMPGPTDEIARALHWMLVNIANDERDPHEMLSNPNRLLYSPRTTLTDSNTFLYYELTVIICIAFVIVYYTYR